MLNPAMTLTFWRLGRLSGRDAAGFAAGQFAGAMVGLGVAALLMGQSVRDIRFAADLPGRYGLAAAWASEFTIALLLACLVFTVNRTRWVKLSGVFAAALLAVCVVVASPVSGTGVNAARTFASSVFAHVWTGWWIYFTAPPLGLLAAVELMRAVGRPPGSLCGKLTHHPSCHFRCHCVTVAGRRAES
jgi:aquaporin Z